MKATARCSNNHKLCRTTAARIVATVTGKQRNAWYSEIIALFEKTHTQKPRPPNCPRREEIADNEFMTMKRRHRTFFYALLMAVALYPSALYAGRDAILDPAIPTYWYVGAFGGLNLNSHSGEYSIYDGPTKCCTFNSGSGTGMVLGLRAYIPLSSSLWLQPRLSYESRGGVLTSAPYTSLILGKNHTVENATLQYELEAGLPYVNLDLLGAWSITPNMGLYLCAGPSIAVAVDAAFSEYDNILSPSGVSFDTLGSTRVLVNSAKLNDYNSLQLGLRAGVGANIHLWKSWFVSPEIIYHLPLSGFSTRSGDSWKGSIVQCTIGITRQL